jgi:hypothetical protein
MMLQGTCDWTHVMENEGLGGLIVAIIWGIWSWFRRHKTATK